MSLRARLLLALVPLFVLCLAAADAAVYADQQAFLHGQLEDQAFNGHIEVETSLLPSAGRQPSGSERLGAGAQPGVVWGELLSPSGKVVAGPQFFGYHGQDQLSATANHPVLPTCPAECKNVSVRGVGTYAEYLLYSEPVNNTGGGNVVVAAVPMDTYNATLGNLLLLEGVVGAGVVVVLVLAAWLIVRRGLRPLERMGATAHAIAAGDLSRRVTPADANTEVGRLGLALNTMLGQMEAAFAQRAAVEQRLRQFVSDASHELRTPLTSMRGYAELVRRNPGMRPEDLGGALRRIEEETRRMGVLVDDLLLLARIDQGRPLERSPVDLEALVMDACADARVSDPGRTITARAAAPLVIAGDEARLRQVLANLLRNALVHTPTGTPIEVEVRPAREMAIIEVIDHGMGIPAAARGRVFERFHRADPEQSRDRGGSGLGLSIVAAVVAAHAGRVGVSDTPGGGATFRIELPLSS